MRKSITIALLSAAVLIGGSGIANATDAPKPSAGSSFVTGSTEAVKWFNDDNLKSFKAHFETLISNLQKVAKGESFHLLQA